MILSRNRKFPPARQCARGLFLRKIEYFSSRILGAGGRGLEGKTIDEGCFSRRTGEGSLITRLIVARLDRGKKSGSRIKKYRLDIPGHPLWQFTSKVDRSKEKQRFFRRNLRKSRRGNSVRMGKNHRKSRRRYFSGN